MKSLILTSLALLSPGCAANEAYYITQREQIAAWERVEVARAQANAKRLDALSTAAHNGSDLARVAVAFAIAGMSGGQQFQTQIPQVQPPQDEVYKWAALILPSATAITSGYFGYKLGVAQSDNARLQTEASYGAITSGFTSNAQIAGYIQTPQPNVTTTTNTTTTSTLSGTGVLGSGTYSYSPRSCSGGNSGSVSTGNSGSAVGGNC